jgi:hypothetical protein
VTSSAAPIRPIRACLLPLLLLLACGQGEEAGRVVEWEDSSVAERAAPLDFLVRVGGTALSEREFDAQIPAEFKGLLTAEEKRSYLDRWVDTQLLYHDAVAQGLLDDPMLLDRLAQQQREFVANHLLQKMLEERVAVTEGEISDYYAEHLDEYSSEYRYREIVVRDREQAVGLSRQLRSKRISFIRAAEQHSLSSSSRIGGDMGWLAKGMMPPEVEERVMRMQRQEITEPFETAWGWTIIQFREKRQSEKALDLQEVRDEILRYLTMELKRRIYGEFIEELRGSYPVSYHPELEVRLQADQITPLAGSNP